MKTHIERTFENLANGNLTDARTMAKRYSTFRLSMYARQILGRPFDESVKAAAYLKGECSFQEYADACNRPDDDESSEPVVSIHDPRYPAMRHLANLP